MTGDADRGGHGREIKQRTAVPRRAGRTARAGGATPAPTPFLNFLNLSPDLYCAIMQPVKFQTGCWPMHVPFASPGRAAPVGEQRMKAFLSQHTTWGCITRIDSPISRLSRILYGVNSQRDRNRRKIDIWMSGV
jgi:hypothetical protein